MKTLANILTCPNSKMSGVSSDFCLASHLLINCRLAAGRILILCLLGLWQLQTLGLEEQGSELQGLAKQDSEVQPRSAERQVLDQDEEGIWMVVNTHERFLRTSPMRIKDEKLDAYLSDLACRVSGEQCGEVRIYALLVPGFNAFMMPNGSMFIQSGLLLRMESESELASVIGHEVAHYTQDHSMNSIRRWQKTSNTFAIIGAVADVAGSLSALNVNDLELSSTALNMLEVAEIYASFQLVAFDRNEEVEADKLGLQAVANAGFDPRAAARVWQNYLAEDEAAGDNGGFSLLATHPSSASRLVSLSELASEIESDYDDAHLDSSGMFAVVDPYRQLWLEAEAEVLHPDQLEALVRRQRKLGSFSDGYLAHLRAKAWQRHAKHQDVNEAERTEAQESALELYRIGARSEAGLPVDAYRDWGHLGRKLGLDDEAKDAYRIYLNKKPDAWDADFIRKQYDL